MPGGGSELTVQKSPCQIALKEGWVEKHSDKTGKMPHFPGFTEGIF